MCDCWVGGGEASRIGCCRLLGAGVWGLGLGVRPGIVGPVPAGAGLAGGVLGGWSDGAGAGERAGSVGDGVVMAGFGSGLVRYRRSSSMVRQCGCICTGMCFLKNLRLRRVILAEPSIRTTY